eukprot:Gb_08404 [translate_table: standard]
MLNNRLVLWIVMGCLLVLNAHGLRARPSFLGHGFFSSALRGRSKASVKQQSNAISSGDLETHHYTQTLDHFTYTPEGYRTFQHRYLVNRKYWGGPQTNSPIFAYTGDEGDIVGDEAYAGFMIDIAPHFQALLVYIEHRYYGSTMPFGSREESYKNASTLGYFTSTQALADYATIIIDLKKNLSAQDCPVIVLGGSYGGIHSVQAVLAAWFRLKYPHIAIGALASSAPILYFENITPQDGYASVVTRDFRSEYGVRPRPHWITTEFGGHDIKRVLKRFGSNIIFSNGLRDPYSSGGVLESISKTIVAIVTNEGSHCEDLHFASEDDPEWLKEQRSKEVNIMKTWIKQYNHDLLQMS